MTQLATTTRDDSRLCRTIHLPDGDILERDTEDLSRWHSSRDGSSGTLLALICTHADAHDLAYARRGSRPEDVAAAAVVAVRLTHARRFLRSVASGSGGYLIHDELEDPVRGEAEVLIGPGHGVIDITGIRDPAIQAWTGLGPTPEEMRRSYAATAWLAYALNRRLGVEFGAIRSPWTGHIPARPWRLHETADTLLLVDAHGDEVMSLRMLHARAGQDVSPDDLAALRRLFDAANSPASAPHEAKK